MPIRPLLAFLFLGLLPGAAVCAEQPRVATSSFVLTVQGDRLTVQLDRAPLGLVVSELARQAGLRGELPASAEDERVSEAFANLPLEEGIARLLGRRSHMLVYGSVAPIPGVAGHGPVRELWVISNAGAARSAPTDAAQAYEFAAGMQTTATENLDPQARLQALEQWDQTRQGALNEGEAMDRVTHALVDPDAQVRARAQELFDQALTNQAAVFSASTPLGAAAK